MLKHILLILLILCMACGKNLGEASADKDPIDNALARMDARDWDSAITILENELDTYPDTNIVLSLLATAYAGKGGVDPIFYGIELGSTRMQEGQNEITKTYSALPDANDGNIALIGTAIDFFEMIPPAERSAENLFVGSMLYSVRFSLISKKYDTEGTGVLTLESLAEMTDEEVEAMLASLDSAADLLNSGSGASSENMRKASQKITAIQNKIDSSPGATEMDRLKNYLANQNSESET